MGYAMHLETFGSSGAGRKIDHDGELALKMTQ
jgi:hypothetical protein